MSKRHTQDEEAQIDMTPMLDVVFIMLIFFIVTTSFVKEAGLDVTRPAAELATARESGNIMIAVSEQGDIWMDKHEIEMSQVQILTEQAVAEYPESSVVVIADERAPSGVVLEVMDNAKQAGVSKISIATKAAGG